VFSRLLERLLCDRDVHLSASDVTWLEEISQDNMAPYPRPFFVIRQLLCTRGHPSTRWAFARSWHVGVARIIRPDLAQCGGIREAKKVATAAEAYCLPIASHNCAGLPAHFASWYLATATYCCLESLHRDSSRRYVPVVNETP